MPSSEASQRLAMFVYDNCYDNSELEIDEDEEEARNPEVANEKGNGDGSYALHNLCTDENITAEALSALLERAPGAANEKNKYGTYPIHYLWRNEKITAEVLSAFLERAP